MGVLSLIQGEMMSAWLGKYAIGLTGNIATGKSVIRRMLEHLGAYGIDADALGHRAITKGAPGFRPVVDAFGKWMLNQDGQIDRAKLARLVFADEQALELLENIVHPLVRQAVDLLISRSKQKVVVIEAIKLLEGPIAKFCDTIWVTYAPEEIQLTRLMEKRGMSESNARQRISSQPPQEYKIGMADVVIRNDESFEATWKQVVTAWRAIFPSTDIDKVTTQVTIAGKFNLQRARPGNAAEIAEFISRISADRHPLTADDIMAAFGEKAYLLLKTGDEIKAIAGWQVENLVTRIDEIYLDTALPPEKTVPALMQAVEKGSRELQCEAALLFLPPDLAIRDKLWSDLGYDESSIQNLKVRAWQEAAIESLPAGSIMRYKRLREDLVMKPV
jgi:dephospho-CoA kinase